MAKILLTGQSAFWSAGVPFPTRCLSPILRLAGNGGGLLPREVGLRPVTASPPSLGRETLNRTLAGLEGRRVGDQGIQLSLPLRQQPLTTRSHRSEEAGAGWSRGLRLVRRTTIARGGGLVQGSFRGPLLDASALARRVDVERHLLRAQRLSGRRAG